MPRAEDIPIARAAVAQVQSRLTDARNNLKFIQSLTDHRAIREEEFSQRTQTVQTGEAALAQAQAELDKLLAGAWKQDIVVADRELAQARASVERTEADIDRLTVRAPIDGVILKLNARAGEYAAAGQVPEPLIVMGSPPPWNVRVDINEEDAGNVQPTARAIAMPRGQAQTHIELEFVRFEPYVVPKRALSGYATERVDTRALQAIYRIKENKSSLFVGEQVDVYIDRLSERVVSTF